jgi:hypothetical protein
MRGFTINHPQNVIAEARELSLDELQNIAGGNGLNPKDRSGSAILHSRLSGNSGINAGPRTVWREGVLHAQEEISRSPTSAAQA